MARKPWSTEERSFDVEVGKRIHAARRAAFMTQRELGAAIGVSQQRVGQFETGLRISPLLLGKAALALGVKVQALMPKVQKTTPCCFPRRIRQQLVNFD